MSVMPSMPGMHTLKGEPDPKKLEEARKERDEKVKKGFENCKKFVAEPSLVDVLAFLESEKEAEKKAMGSGMGMPDIPGMGKMPGMDSADMMRNPCGICKNMGTKLPCTCFPYNPWDAGACIVAPPCAMVPRCKKKFPMCAKPFFLCHPNVKCCECCCCCCQCCDCCTCKEVGIELCGLCHLYYCIWPGCISCCCQDEKLVNEVVYKLSEAPGSSSTGGAPPSAEMTRG